MKKIVTQTFKNFKNPYVMAWFVLSLTMLYVYVTVLFEFSDWMIFGYALLMIPFLFGLSKLYREERLRTALYKIDYYDAILVFIGVIITYLISHQLDISAVIASSFVGVLGFILLKKYAVAIYCGSFAGMVSTFLFAYVEVAIIALLCGILFTLLKPAFRGMGGKLGTTAFMSTILIATLFQKDFVIVANDISTLRLMIISLAGVVIPFYFQHYFKQSPVLASALTSLIFALIFVYIIKDFFTCTIVFFSASFIGMSSKKRLPNLIFVVIAALIHAFLFHVYFEHYNGLGGKLGLMAMSSVTITVGIRYMYDLLTRKYRLKDVM